MSITYITIVQAFRGTTMNELTNKINNGQANNNNLDFIIVYVGTNHLTQKSWHR